MKKFYNLGTWSKNFPDISVMTKNIYEETKGKYVHKVLVNFPR